MRDAHRETEILCATPTTCTNSAHINADTSKAAKVLAIVGDGT